MLDIIKLLDLDNIERYFITSVEFYASSKNIPYSAHSLARHVVQMLNPHQLVAFTWPTGIHLPPYISHLLWNRHGKTLANLQFDDDIWDEPKETKAALDDFASSTHAAPHLQITPKTYAGLAHVYNIFRKFSKYGVQPGGLELDLDALQPRMKAGERGMFGHFQEDITCTMFQHMTPFRKLVSSHATCLRVTILTKAQDSPPFTSITTLTLCRVNLFLTQDTFAKLFNFSMVRHLELKRCPFAGELINAVAQADVSLQVLKIDHNVDDALEHCPRDLPEPAEAITVALEKLFEEIFGGLHTLWLRVRGAATTPSLANAARHANDLKSIYIDVQAQDEGFGMMQQLPLLFWQPCVDLAVAVSTAWDFETLVKAADFQKYIVRDMSPPTLTIVVPGSMFASFAYNSASDDGVVSAEDIAHKIAAATFAAEKDLRRHPEAGKLDCVVIAVEPEAAPTSAIGSSNESKSTSTRSSPQQSHALLSTTPARSARVQTSATSIYTGSSGSGGRRSRAQKVDKFVFVRGEEKLRLRGVEVVEKIAVLVAGERAAALGVTVPTYFGN